MRRISSLRLKPRVSIPIRTARMMKAPTNAPCQFESMPAMSRALRITSSSAEPTIAP